MPRCARTVVTTLGLTLTLTLALTVLGCTRTTAPRTAASDANAVSTLVGGAPGAHMPASPANGELCRRLAIDILGRIPTPAENEQCLEAPVTQTVDAWLTHPDYVLAQQRYWAALLDISGGGSSQLLTEDLDALVGSLASDRVGYAEFATRVVVHPTFYERHPSSDWIRAIFDTFLGRTARPEEVRDLSALVPVWTERRLVSRREREDTIEVAFSLCSCGEGGCRSDALGRDVVFDFDCPEGAEDEYGMYSRREGMVRLVDNSVVPDGFARRFREDDGRRSQPLRPATAEERKQLFSLGDALTARRDFYEAAVDRELIRLLGWWQSSFNQPETDLPAVRTLLAESLQGSGSMRALHRSILASVMYTMPSQRPGHANGPAWSAGPRKFMPVEVWLEAASTGTGRELPRCHHFDEAQSESPYDYYGYDDLDDEGFDDFGEYDEVRIAPEETFDFLSAARSLGGDCRHTTIDRPTIGNIEAQRAVAMRLCSEGRSVLPTGVDLSARPPPLGDAADHLVQRLLGRPIVDEERRALTRDMSNCIRRGPRGCRSVEEAVRWTCVRLLLSAEFATY